MQEANKFFVYHVNLIYRPVAIFKLRLKTALLTQMTSQGIGLIEAVMKLIDKSTWDYYGTHDLYFKEIMVKELKKVDSQISLGEPSNVPMNVEYIKHLIFDVTHFDQKNENKFDRIIFQECGRFIGWFNENYIVLQN